ncbi:MAG: ATP-binding cassette domain-containing protein [Bacteroidales bacterium]|nr:ATP-binding cassette domain-containing protein [Bacteroidales bacterium]
MDLLVVENITKTFAKHRALNDVSINVPEGSIYGLLGPNGAGKTTLIRIINQITGPDSGKVLLNGEPLQPKHIANIGYLPEERGLYKKMKVGEQAMYLAMLKGLSKKEAKDQLKIWFKKFDIAPWWDKKVEELSKGMAQKVQFIVTILHKPKLLIFDEPFSGFDPVNQEILKAEILDLRDQGATVIFSTHNMSSVEEICDHIALINKSKKILEGSVSEIRDTYKKGTYELEYDGNEVELSKFLPINFEIISKQKIIKGHKAIIKLPSPTYSNELLSTMMEHTHIRLFKEIIPSMNEIFIDKVTQD